MNRFTGALRCRKFGFQLLLYPKLDFVKVTPPVRPGTRAGWGMCICGGRLAISLLTDPFTFSDDDTQELIHIQ